MVNKYPKSRVIFGGIHPFLGTIRSFLEILGGKSALKGALPQAFQRRPRRTGTYQQPGIGTLSRGSILLSQEIRMGCAQALEKGARAMKEPGAANGTALTKLWPDARSALEGIVRDGMLLAIGGFGLCGVPDALILALRISGVRNLTIASNNAGVDEWGIGMLLQTRQVKKMISSYVGENNEFERQYLEGELEVEFCPQGTLAERLRAGGAGIPGFYTRTGVGTLVAEGKEHKEFYGVSYILERGIQADLALVKAWKADRLGNLIYRRTARNFNPNAATCGRITVAEAEIVVEPGELDPDEIHTPGIFVHRLVHNPNPEKRIEKVTTREA